MFSEKSLFAAKKHEQKKKKKKHEQEKHFDFPEFKKLIKGDFPMGLEWCLRETSSWLSEK